jgi:hypothetical protein
MAYETLNWKHEANRVAAAFGAEGECEFVEFDAGQRLLQWRGWSRIYLAGSLYFGALYDGEGRLFSVTEGYTDAAEIFISWDGSVNQRPWFYKHNILLARALFHLQLLTPEVEGALNVSVTAHDKLEWTLNYRERSYSLS